MSKSIHYYEEDGKLRYSYSEYEIKGVVPRKIINQGEEAIRAYVTRKVEKALKLKREAAKKHEDFAKNPNVMVETLYQGITLKGVISYADGRLLVVRMSAPYEGEASVNFGWASAIAGRHMYESGTILSGAALEAAKKLLVKIYQEKSHELLHRDTIDLARKLNEYQKE